MNGNQVLFGTVTFAKFSIVQVGFSAATPAPTALTALAITFHKF
jgi:hypothetical protein